MQRYKKISTLIILSALLLVSGCSKKNTEIILAEPTQVSEDSNEKAVSEGEKQETDKADDSSALESADEDEPEEAKCVMVHVCGAVLCEGVYELPAGSRVVDAVKAAGGFSGDADSSFVNQAQVLEDGVKLRIPTIEESSALNQDAASDNGAGPQTAGISGGGEASDQGEKSSDGKVNINTASETELCTIPGIGPGRAKNILAYREEKGKFGTIEDIKNVSGIKDKFFAKIKDYITV
ncbi:MULTISPECIES: helix-hairpin-helix domain-containing protein [unclassified Butyrivibrio]|uniref:helix-hairpin-helix domain-containing protein n=1 Tax=unclassified Butyrivibrio TaxID=2639466 RepID=UPI000426FCB3|nr:MULTISPECIES: helix-hairpin-helix domain-containing protein [unclassified Butyrivibrio]